MPEFGELTVGDEEDADEEGDEETEEEEEEEERLSRCSEVDGDMGSRKETDEDDEDEEEIAEADADAVRAEERHAIEEELLRRLNGDGGSFDDLDELTAEEREYLALMDGELEEEEAEEEEEDDDTPLPPGFPAEDDFEFLVFDPAAGLQRCEGLLVEEGPGLDAEAVHEACVDVVEAVFQAVPGFVGVHD